jgi:heme exporter protein D
LTVFSFPNWCVRVLSVRGVLALITVIILVISVIHHHLVRALEVTRRRVRHQEMRETQQAKAQMPAMAASDEQGY